MVWEGVLFWGMGCALGINSLWCMCVVSGCALGVCFVWVSVFGDILRDMFWRCVRGMCLAIGNVSGMCFSNAFEGSVFGACFVLGNVFGILVVGEGRDYFGNVQYR